MIENNQTPIPADLQPSGQMLVHSVFPTIQGEGPLCGERALFIRLYGCNLRCPGCDTDYTSKNVRATAGYFLRQAEQHNWPAGGLVVITGGEPLRQNIAPAVELLLEAGYRVQIETNGVLSAAALPIKHPRFHIVCSPKTSAIHRSVYDNADAFKYVLQNGNVDAEDGLPTRALMHPASPKVARPRPGAIVYVQPMDEDDEAANLLNLSCAISSVMLFGHRLQIQVHKHINME